MEEGEKEKKSLERSGKWITTTTTADAWGDNAELRGVEQSDEE